MTKADDVLFEFAPDAILVVNPKGLIVRFNAQAEKMFGYAPDEIIGKPVEVLIPHRYHGQHENNRAQYALSPVARTMGQCLGLYALKKDGTEFSVDISISPMETEDGSSVICIIRDITERRQMEDALYHKNEELEVHNEILRVIHSTRDLQERLNLILKEIIRFLKVEVGALHLVQGDKIILKSHVHLPDEIRAHALSFPLNALPFWAKGTNVVNERLSEKGITPDFVKKEGIQSWVSFALHLPPHESGKEGEYIGYLIAGSRRYKAFKEEDVSVVRMLLYQISLAIDNARNYRNAEERLARLSILRSIDKAIIQHLELRQVLRVVLDRLPKELGADAASICLVDKKTWKMDLCAARLPDGTQCEDSLFTLAESLLDKFVNKKETVIIYDVNEDPRLQMHVEKIQCGKFVSYLGVPLIVHNETIGVLHILTTAPKKFMQEDVSFFRTLAGQAAIAIENARMYEKVRKQAEHSAQLLEQLELAHEELKTAQRHITQQERLRAMGEMASGIAHDFNNALMSILGFTDLLLNFLEEEGKVEPDKLKSYLELIKTGAQDAASTVTRLREFYKKSEKKEEMSLVNLSELVSHAVEITKPRWKGMSQSKGVEIKIKKELSDAHTVKGSPSALREILTNLIFNAVDAMPKGGEITLSTAAVEGADGKPHVCLCVTDTGMGMSEDVRLRCLDPFFTTKKERGTGLGLSMVHGIVKRHDGKLEIESEEGKGTTFIIHLPAHTDGEEKKGAEEGKEKPMRILDVLVVDDEPSIRMVMSEYLKIMGHHVETAANASEAFVWLEAQKFDLVLTDMSMPGLSGEQMAKHIKNKFPGISVVLLTGFGDILHSTKEKMEGVDMILSKPITLDALRAAVDVAAGKGEGDEGNKEGLPPSAYH